MTETTPASRPAESRTLPTLGLFVTVFCWGSYFPVIEALLSGWDAYTMSAARAALAAATLLTLLLVTEGWRPLFQGLPWRRIWIIGVFGVNANMILIAVGIGYSGAVPAALIAGMTPALAALMASVVYRERLALGVWVAVAVAVAGVFLVVLGGAATGAEFRGGEILVLMSYVLWTWSLFVVQRWLPGRSQLCRSTAVMLTGSVATVATVGLLYLVGFHPGKYDASLGSLGLLLYSAVFSVAIGSFLWNYGVSRLGVTIVSLWGNLVPIVAVLLAVWWQDAPVSWLQAAGGALVLASVVHIQLKRPG